MNFLRRRWAKKKKRENIDAYSFLDYFRQKRNRKYHVPRYEVQRNLFLEEYKDLSLAETQQSRLQCLSNVREEFLTPVYYISDLHLEHQIKGLVGSSSVKAQKKIRKKVLEMLATVPRDQRTGILLVGGDVADCKELEGLFYQTIVNGVNDSGKKDEIWFGPVIAVLGNHELWDGDPQGEKEPRNVDDVIADYREIINTALWSNCKDNQGVFLENALYFKYKGQKEFILNENELLSIDKEELSNICRESIYIILGGVGFSGLDKQYNAHTGFYRNKLTQEQDRVRSERFRLLHDKLLSCAHDEQIIVLTHTPIRAWTDGRPNPNWIYVNGHTHQNIIRLKENEAPIFADNQVGYKKRPWVLKNFIVRGIYDPFMNLENGLHEITRGQYWDFYRSRGVDISFGKIGNEGCLYVVKHNEYYLFLQTKLNKNYWLEGGNIHKAGHELQYYADNLSRYINLVETTFSPYRNLLKRISDEVKQFGGWGNIHGFIVDIDFYNHIYLDPFMIKLRPYYALSQKEWTEFGTVKDLLQASPNQDTLLATKYDYVEKRGLIPTISSKNANSEICDLIKIPEVVLPKSEYRASRTMRAIQYLMDDCIVRIWNDEVFQFEKPSNCEQIEQQPSFPPLSIQGYRP